MAKQPSENGRASAYDPNRYPRPSLSADAIVFSYFDRRLQVLLVLRKNDPFRGHWVFPGGFVDVYEDPTEAAHRELHEETGIQVDELMQLRVFGRPDRDPRYHVVAVAHFGIALPGSQTPQGGDDALQAAWYPAHKTPPLAFDHDEVLDAALARLKSEIVRPSFAMRFFERRFTGRDLLGLYQEVLGKRLNGRRFLGRLSRVCLERPAMDRSVRINRAALRKFESQLGVWWE